MAGDACGAVSPHGKFVEQINYQEIDEGEILGKGSFGVVLRGRWRSMDVAIKIFQTEQEHAAFLVELRQLSRVEHENIIKLYGASNQPPYIFLVMEYAENGSLYKVLHQMKQIVPYHSGHAISWAWQCAKGVEYLHNIKPKPLIHRDLKSPNLLLVQKGLVLKICDFGTACDKQTVMTNNKGSAAWMAPEVFEGNTYTEKCDIFSWGIILWEVLTRRLPFDEIRGNDLRVLWAIHSGKRPPPILDCPEILESLMNKCWNKDAGVRPTMGEIVSIMQFIARFFPPPDDPLIFPVENDQDPSETETLPSSCYESAKENVSKSEVEKHEYDKLSLPRLQINKSASASESNKSSPISSKIFKIGFSFPPKDLEHRSPTLEVTTPILQRGVSHQGQTNPQEIPNFTSSSSLPVFHQPQGFWTPPEEAVDFQIPALPHFDPSQAGHLPPELARAAWRQQYRLSDYMPTTSYDATLASNMLERTHLSSDIASTPPIDSAPPVSNWSHSFQNPVGNIYYPPCTSENAWPPSSQQQGGVSPIGATPHSTATPPLMYPYYGMFRPDQPMFYDPRPPALGPYLPKPAKATPLALGSFLPMCYRGMSSPQGSQNFDISPKSRRSAKSQRPYSADVNQLFSVDEDARSSHSGSFKKGHRRASSYGSSAMGHPGHQLHPPHLLRGHSQNDLYGPRSLFNPQAYYYGPEAYLDHAVDLLDPDLKPIPPQPNCPESMQVYEEHRLMAADYLEVQKELESMRTYKAELEEKLRLSEAQMEEAASKSGSDEARKFVQLQKEKDSLVQFRDKLSTQLQMIKKAQSKQEVQKTPPTTNVDEDWVLVHGSTQAENNPSSS